MIDTAKVLIHVLNTVYPVGIYLHTSDGDFDPNIDIGGVWELMGEGQVLLAGSKSGTYKVGNQYGSNTHKLTVDEMPAHSHIRNANGGYDNGFSTGSGRTIPTNNSVGNQNNVRTASEGGGQAHSIMQLSTAVYIWHRTA